MDRQNRGITSRRYSAVLLVTVTRLYFGLNTLSFNFAWPWDEWTGRTPNQLIFMVCTGALTVAALTAMIKRTPKDAA